MTLPTTSETFATILKRCAQAGVPTSPSMVEFIKIIVEEIYKTQTFKNRG